MKKRILIVEDNPLFDKVIVTQSRHPRAMAPALLEAEFARHGVEALVADDVPTALSLALDENRSLICIAGSLFVVGEAIEQASMQARISKQSLEGETVSNS